MTGPEPADAVIVTGTVRLDVTAFAERLAQLIVRGLVARGAAADAADRTGNYVPDLPRKVPPRVGEYGPEAGRLVARRCPTCGGELWVEADAPAETLCATCQNHGDLRTRE